ncbi:MAG: prepilin peptidase [Gallintestinimicrobium sp.]
MKETGSYLLDALFMGGLITASLCDFKKRKIPDAITGFLFLTGVAAIFWMPQPSIRMRLAGAFIAGLPLFAAAVCRPGAVGGGDVKLMAAGGFFLGLSAVWDSLAFGMALAGGILSVSDVVSKRERAKDCAWTVSEYGTYAWNVPVYGNMIRNRRADL